MPEPIAFRAWPKIARLNRDIVITEKIDGTNAAIGVTEDGQIYAQSRTRIITPERDNFGFAAWVASMGDQLADLGPGLHFGEWWGQGIQRGYDLNHRRFSLFNVARWGSQDVRYNVLDPIGISVVPVLYEGAFSQLAIDYALRSLETAGSRARPDFMHPEGIVIFHKAAGTMFKVTLENDGQPKDLIA